MIEPFAVELYRQYLNGRSPEELAADLSIPIDRIRQRLRAAAHYLSCQKQAAAAANAAPVAARAQRAAN